ncbi:hypothetical protein VTK26DRAFT_5249 [Humicola hyalothermophila]
MNSEFSKHAIRTSTYRTRKQSRELGLRVGLGVLVFTCKLRWRRVGPIEKLGSQGVQRSRPGYTTKDIARAAVWLGVAVLPITDLHIGRPIHLPKIGKNRRTPESLVDQESPVGSVLGRSSGFWHVDLEKNRDDKKRQPERHKHIRAVILNEIRLCLINLHNFNSLFQVLLSQVASCLS